MKTRKILVLSLALVLLVLCLCACSAKENEQSQDDLPTPIELTSTDLFVVLTPDASNAGTTLLEYMNNEKANGNIDFTTDSTNMVTSINGTANPADYSKCWMLYTTDSNNANATWGRIKYQNTIYDSASLGAASLIITNGAIYIWYYQSF